MQAMVAWRTVSASGSLVAGTLSRGDDAAVGPDPPRKALRAPTNRARSGARWSAGRPCDGTAGWPGAGAIVGRLVMVWTSPAVRASSMSLIGQGLPES